MTSKISKWADVRMDFFLEEVLDRFWNHSGNTKDLIIEIQYFPALLNGDHEKRAFIGAGITIDFPYSQRKETVRGYFEKKGNMEAIKDFERKHALGFVMTGEEECKVDAVTIVYGATVPYRLFMENFGVGYEEAKSPVFFWYNVGEDGKIDTKSSIPRPDRRIRVRFLKKDYFMEIMKYYVEHDFEYPESFIKEDAECGG